MRRAQSQTIPQKNVRAGSYSPTYKILESLRKAEEQEAAKNGTPLPNIADMVADDGVVYAPSAQAPQPNKSTSSAQAVRQDNYAATASQTVQQNSTTSQPDNSEPTQVQPAEPSNKPDLSKMDKNSAAYKYTVGKQETLFDDDFLTEKARLSHRVIGQVFETYWLIEYNDNLYIMDQHAAHEKVKYEELMENLKINRCFPSSSYRLW